MFDSCKLFRLFYVLKQRMKINNLYDAVYMYLGIRKVVLFYTESDEKLMLRKKL